MDDRPVVVEKRLPSPLNACRVKSVEAALTVAVATLCLVLAPSFSVGNLKSDASASPPEGEAAGRLEKVVHDIARNLRHSSELDVMLSAKLDAVVPEDEAQAVNLAQLLQSASDPYEFIAACLVDVDSTFSRYGRLSDRDNVIAETIARELSRACFANEAFRDKYVRYYVWSRLLVPHENSRIEQVTAIQATIQDIEKHLETAAPMQPFFWRDCLRIVTLCRVLDLSMPKSVPRNNQELQVSFTRLKDGFAEHRVISLIPRDDGLGWREAKKPVSKIPPANIRDFNFDVARSPSSDLADKKAMKLLREIHIRATDADLQADEFYFGTDSPVN